MRYIKLFWETNTQLPNIRVELIPAIFNCLEITLLPYLFRSKKLILLVEFRKTHNEIAQLSKIKELIGICCGLIINSKKNLAHRFPVQRLTEVFVVFYETELLNYVFVDQDTVDLWLALQLIDHLLRVVVDVACVNTF